MRSSVADRVAVVCLASALGVAGCVEPIELGGDTSAGEDAGDRVDAGGCRTTDDCDRGRCIDGTCRLDAACASVTERCDADADCCGGVCEAGRCASLGGCLPEGERCATAGACCSQACQPVVGAGRRCTDLGGCKPAGELCRRDADCCNVLSPAPCRIVDAGRGLGRCVAPTTGCLPAGELCDEDVSSCCDEDEGTGDELTCEPTAVAETVFRCLSERSEDDCFEAGAPCAVPEECCSGRCDALRCAAGGRRSE